jgi:hypothetical protein
MSFGIFGLAVTQTISKSTLVIIIYYCGLNRKGFDLLIVYITANTGTSNEGHKQDEVL